MFVLHVNWFHIARLKSLMKFIFFKSVHEKYFLLRLGREIQLSGNCPSKNSVFSAETNGQAYPQDFTNIFITRKL